MSHHGRRRHAREEHHQRDLYETPEQKLRKSIIHYGEVDPVQELPRLERQIVEQVPANIPVIAEGFRVGVTEQPFKIPYYAALIRLLFNRTQEGSSASLGRQVLEEFRKGFQAFLDKLAWREIRLCVQFFAHLTVAGVIASSTMHELVKKISDVFDELSATRGRMLKAALCTAEGIILAGDIFSQEKQEVNDIILKLSTFAQSIRRAKSLVTPVVELHSNYSSLEHTDEWLDSALAALQTLSEQNFAQMANSVPRPYLDLPPIEEEQFLLPVITVPPEVDNDDSTESGEEGVPIKKEDWPQCYIRLFDDDNTPDPRKPAGYILRSNIIDIIDIFEVNRKECARLLLEYPKWTLPGTFKARPGAPLQPEVANKNWELDNTIVETILGCNFILPESTHKAVYYIALITELCKSSPTTVGPAVGKSVRRLYALLADGLDVEVSHRFAEWFSVHMSNFGFQWPWREWASDLALVTQHPKRSFMRRAVEFEIRLSYFDRILRILPETMAEPSAHVMPPRAPGPEFEYEEAENPHHEAAQSVLNLLRGRAKPEDVMTHLESLRNSLLETIDPEVNVGTLLRSITVQSLLSIGSRSFSHFLNAIERYLPLLRNLATGNISSTGSTNAGARTDIMVAVATVWRRSRHMILIVFDKLMQYQIVDPTDVVAFAFTHYASVTEGTPKTTFSAHQWDVLKSALDKASGRVMIQRKKVAVLRREAEERAGRVLASESATMEVDTEPTPDVVSAPAGESPQLTTAVNTFNILAREEKAALSRSFEGFVDCLAVDAVLARAGEVISEHAWHNRANWENEAWEMWETWGWYHHWVRTYSPYLKTYMTTIGTIGFAKVPLNDGNPAAELFRKAWNIATDQDEV